MEITKEILALYAEGRTSTEETAAVRQYLIAHPQEMELVTMMMDEDLDLDASSNQVNDKEQVPCLQTCKVESGLFLTAAAFAVPFSIGKHSITNAISRPSSQKQQSFNDRLDDLLDSL